MVRCFRCGRDASTCEGGPTADEAGQVRRWEAMLLDVCDDGDCRVAVCCWPCFWSFEPDMWILAEHWRAADPLVGFRQLPWQLPSHEAEDVSRYDFVWNTVCQHCGGGVVDMTMHLCSPEVGARRRQLLAEARASGLAIYPPIINDED